MEQLIINHFHIIAFVCVSLIYNASQFRMVMETGIGNDDDSMIFTRLKIGGTTVKFVNPDERESILSQVRPFLMTSYLKWVPPAYIDSTL